MKKFDIGDNLFLLLLIAITTIFGCVAIIFG
jgi:hypothetical protein